MKTKQVLRFFTVCMAIVLTFGNAVVGFTPVAVTDVPGSARAPVGTTPLDSGWNPVGYPSHSILPVPAALSAHDDTDILLVYAYHAPDTADSWKKYGSDVTYGNDLAEMAPGWGYWD